MKCICLRALWISISFWTLYQKLLVLANSILSSFLVHGYYISKLLAVRRTSWLELWLIETGTEVMCTCTGLVHKHLLRVILSLPTNWMEKTRRLKTLGRTKPQDGRILGAWVTDWNRHPTHTDPQWNVLRSENKYILSWPTGISGLLVRKLNILWLI